MKPKIHKVTFEGTAYEVYMIRKKAKEMQIKEVDEPNKSNQDYADFLCGLNWSLEEQEMLKRRRNLCRSAEMDNKHTQSALAGGLAGLASAPGVGSALGSTLAPGAASALGGTRAQQTNLEKSAQSYFYHQFFEGTILGKYVDQ